MDKQLSFESSGTPSKSGVYMVDRGEKQGKAFRFYNAENNQWSITCYDPQEAMALKDTATALPFLPYHANPVKVKDASVTMKLIPTPTKAQKASDNRILKAVTKPKAVKADKVVHPDGTIFFREDRQKWVVIVEGKQPAARPTKEGVVKWLASKHPNITPSFL